MRVTTEELKSVQRLMDNLEADLLKMPAHKKGTPWHTWRQGEWVRLRDRRNAMQLVS